MSPFPGEPIGDDPNSAIHATNAQLLAEVGQGDPAAGSPSHHGSGWPTGLGPSAPSDIASLGLPAHLTMPGSTFVPSPVDRDPQAGLALVDRSTAATTPDAETRQLMMSPADDQPTQIKCPKCDHKQAASHKKCAECGHDLKKARGAKFAKLDAGVDYGIPDGHRVKLYQMALAQDGLREGIESDGLIWKIACKSGTLALSPGPGNVAVEKPLHLTGELFRDMVESLTEKAFPYCTVPETHNNGSLENTGYVREAAVLTKEQALLDQRISQKAREYIQTDPEDTEYLLAGIEFTNATAKARAVEGSIPDTSIGVKFGWRNTRTGKAFRAAWEHLALTPMPWVDGLPAFGMSADGFTPPTQMDREQYDGVFVDLPLAIEASVTSGGSRWEWEMTDINPSQIRSDAQLALGVIGTDGRVQLPFGVRVSRFSGQYVVQSDRDQIVGIAPDDNQALDLAMSAVRESYERERENRQRGDTASPMPNKELPPWPEIELAIHFDPKAHPRDFKGRFTETLDKLGDGEEATLPGGVRVRKTVVHHDTHSENSFVVEKDGHEVSETADVERAVEQATEASVNADPGATFDDDGNVQPSTLKKALDKSIADVDAQHPRDGSIPIAKDLRPGQGAPEGQWTQHSSGDMEIEMPGNGPTAKITQAEHEGPHTWSVYVWPTGDAHSTTAERHDFTDVAAAKKWADQQLRGTTHASQNGAAAGAEGLTLSGSGATMGTELYASQQENPHMPRTVEELLASQQVDLEQAQQQIAALTGQLQLAQGTITSQGEQLHMDAVRKRIKSLEGVVSPSLALAAKTLMEADKSRITGEGGLNLSISTAVTGADGQEGVQEKILKSATDIVEYMLSAAATDHGDIATRMAGVQNKVGILQLSAHEAKTAEDAARSAVEDNERVRHPERFKDNGKGERL